MSNLVDFIPLLQYLPTPMRTRGRNLHRGLVDTYGGFINEIDHKLKRGQPVKDCLAKSMLQMRQKEELDHLDMSILASAFMIGGVETVCLPPSLCLSYLTTSILITIPTHRPHQ